jgi:hypothetical protein
MRRSLGLACLGGNVVTKRARFAIVTVGVIVALNACGGAGQSALAAIESMPGTRSR